MVLAARMPGKCVSQEILQSMLPTAHQEEAMCARMVQAGARDGMSSENKMFVDGMPLGASIAVLEQIRELAFQAL